jgi:hypothetical protein
LLLKRGDDFVNTDHLAIKPNLHIQYSLDGGLGEYVNQGSNCKFNIYPSA